MSCLFLFGAVSRARNLIVKGKSGTNDAYVTIKLGDEKYQTSIKERSSDPEWMEECDLPLVDAQGVIHLNVYHRNLLGIDEFLGHLDVSLEQFKIYERPRSRWYALRNKTSSKKAEKYRGEIEVKVTFIVQSVSSSHTSLNKAHSVKGFKRSSSIKTLAHSVGERLTTVKWPSKDRLTLSGSKQDLSTASDQPLAPFRRKKKSRLSKMSILSQSTLTLDAGKSAPSGELCNESDLKDSRPLLNPILAKSMFDLSTPTIEEITGGNPQPDVQHSDSENETETGKSQSQNGDGRSEGQGTTLSESAGTVENEQTSATENSQVYTDVDFHERAIDVSFASRNKEVISTPNKSIQMSPQPKESLLTQEESANPPPASPQKTPRSPAKVTEEENTKVKVTGSDPKDTEHAEPMDTGNDLARSEDTLEDKTLPRETQEENDGEKIGSENDNEGSPDASSPEKDGSKRSSGQYSRVVVETVARDPQSEESVQRERRDKYKRMKEVNRRHTIGRHVARAATHDLHEGIAEYRRAQEERDRPLPPEVMDTFKDHSREDLVRLILEQRHLLHKKDTYNRDLEDYIDNLLVKVMEVTPKLLMQPCGRPSPPKTVHQGGSTVPSSPAHPPANHRPSSRDRKNNALNNVNNCNNFGVIATDGGQKPAPVAKKQFNPFKKLQQALK